VLHHPSGVLRLKLYQGDDQPPGFLGVILGETPVSRSPRAGVHLGLAGLPKQERPLRNFRQRLKSHYAVPSGDLTKSTRIREGPKVRTMEEPKKGRKNMYDWRSTHVPVALSEGVAEHQQTRISVDEERVDIEPSSN
jgi:hypothetical protein